MSGRLDRRSEDELITEDPLLTAEQRAMVQSLDALCAKVLTDEYQREIDEAARYPQEAMDALAAEAGRSSVSGKRKVGLAPRHRSLPHARVDRPP